MMTFPPRIESARLAWLYRSLLFLYLATDSQDDNGSRTTNNGSSSHKRNIVLLPVLRVTYDIQLHRAVIYSYLKSHLCT
ncbi:hypothetical protein DL96DRAFT_1618824 [Flagelloscypha sp. PMI_526]|nr:hypothetical protein DL96DRAFT_1618824 [Flagelloscypha sp. PMI_526]